MQNVLTKRRRRIMPINLTDKLYDHLSNDAITKLQKSMYRCVDLIETFFPDPDDINKKIKLYPDQRDAIDTAQYGYPVSRFKFDEIKRYEEPEGVILMSRRQVGKSILCGDASAGFNIIGAGFPDYRIPCYCGIISASEDESFELIDKTKFALRESDFNDFVLGRPKKDRIELINGSFTRAHPCSELSVRGKKYHYLFIDEGRWMDEKVLFEAALPTIQHGIRWFAITTPQGTQGRLTQQYIKAISERPVICTECLTIYKQSDFINAEFPIKNQIWLMPNLPGCKVCGCDKYKYGYGYIATPWIDPWNCPIINKEKLKRRLDYYSWSPWIRQEELGELIDEASMIFMNDWIVNSTNKSLRNVMTKRNDIAYVLGLDFGRLHDSTCFVILHKNENQQIIFDYMRSISGEFDIETDWDAIDDQAQEIIEFYKPVLAVMDSTGMSYREVESIYKNISLWSPGTQIYHSQKNWRNLPPERRRLGFWFDRINKPQLVGNMKALFSTNPPRLQIPPKTEPEIDEFVAELLRFECKVHPETGYIEYGTQDYHDDRLIAYALALWGLTEKQNSPRALPRGAEYNYLPKQQKIPFKGEYNYAKNRKIGVMPKMWN